MALCVCGFALAYFFLCSYLDKGVEEVSSKLHWYVVRIYKRRMKQRCLLVSQENFRKMLFILVYLVNIFF